VAAAAWNPFGSLDSATASSGTVTVRGWTIDPDRWTSALAVHVYVDGRYAGAMSAAGARYDVARAYPQAGTRHGYVGILRGMAPGNHQVCTYALNVGSGTRNPVLGCRTVTV
jgi:hypothetical protein